MRCKTVENATSTRSSSETNTVTDLSPIKRPPIKPVFIVKPRNSLDSSGAIQYEVVEINSAAQYIELSSNLDVVEHIDTKEKSIDINKSSADVNTPKCNGNRKQHLQIEQQSNTSETSFPSQTNPDSNSQEKVEASTAEILENKILTTPKNKDCAKATRKIVKNHLQTKQHGIKYTLVKKLSRIDRCLKENSFKFQYNYTDNKLLLAVYNSIQTISIYMTLVEFNLKMANAFKRTNKEGGDDLNRRVKLTEDVAAENQDINNPCSNTNVNVATKRNPKAQRSDNTRLMLLRETKEDINEKDLGEFLRCHFQFTS